jgi:hypothetical protein
MLLAWRSDLLGGSDVLVGYRGLANEARERAARASNLSIKDKFEEVAKEWSALAVRAELANLRIEDYALGAKGCRPLAMPVSPSR